VTRRTPKPGDSYTKGAITLVVDDVTSRYVWTSRWKDGYLCFVTGLHKVELQEFHDQIAKATWGRP
jgi:hypothetical protein